MKKILFLTTLICFILGCSYQNKPKSDPIVATPTKPKNIASWIKDFPNINDSTAFIHSLKQSFEFHIDESPVQKEQEKITAFEKVKLYGSDKIYYIIEYDYVVGSGATSPWKYQFLLNTKGDLVKILAGYRFEVVSIFPNENPFLMLVLRTSKGNGGHEIYKVQSDTLINIYEGYFDYNLRTYDAHEDNKICKPNELNLTVKDYNKDGVNDISFKGNYVLISGLTPEGIWYDVYTKNGKTFTYSVDNPFKIFPVEFIFLYDKKTGYFKAKEDYAKKYEQYD